MTCDVRPHFHNLRCAFESVFVETCDVLYKFLGLQSAMASLHVFNNSARNDDRNCLSFVVNYVSVAQKLKILAILTVFVQKKVHFWLIQ